LAIVQRFSLSAPIAVLLAACSYDFDRFASGQRAEAFGGNAWMGPPTGGSAAGQVDGTEGGSPVIAGTGAVNAGTNAVNAGTSAVNAGTSAVSAGTSAVNAGQNAVNGGADGFAGRESLTGGGVGAVGLGGTSGASASDAIGGTDMRSGGAPSGGDTNGPKTAPGDGASAGQNAPEDEPRGASEGGQNAGGAGKGGADASNGGESSVAATLDCDRLRGIVWGGRCYFSISAPTTWVVARDACGARASHLVSITSAEEQAFVHGAFLVTSAHYWLGLSLEDVRGGPVRACPSRPAACDFRWTSGEPFEYQNWAVGELSAEPNYTGGCVRFGVDSVWADTDCNVALQALCERDG
jgi:hypothetical protein